jgi:hypothetical protein
MSPIRGDVKKKFFSLLSVREGDVVAYIQPHLQSEKFFAACTPDRPQPVDGFSRWFHEARVVQRLRFRKLRKQNGVALIGQPWSYLRLDAYSFLWLCEGA